MKSDGISKLFKICLSVSSFINLERQIISVYGIPVGFIPIAFVKLPKDFLPL